MPQFDLRVNGKSHQVEGAPDDSLLSVLRYELNLTGSKFGCGEGQCGACTVLIDGRRRGRASRRSAPWPASRSRRSKRSPSGGKLHPVQQAFLDAEAFQCGYCTAGMVMATIGLLRVTPNPSDADIARLMDRNVCRCGTYPRIVTAIKRAANRLTRGMTRTGELGNQRPAKIMKRAADPEFANTIEPERYELDRAAALPLRSRSARVPQSPLRHGRRPARRRDAAARARSRSRGAAGRVRPPTTSRRGCTSTATAT